MSPAARRRSSAANRSIIRRVPRTLFAASYRLMNRVADRAEPRGVPTDLDLVELWVASRLQAVARRAADWVRVLEADFGRRSAPPPAARPDHLPKGAP